LTSVGTNVPRPTRVDPLSAVDYIGGPRFPRTVLMRAETEKNVAEIEQVLNLLRRHL
jgi:hypothetical protein